MKSATQITPVQLDVPDGDKNRRGDTEALRRYLRARKGLMPDGPKDWTSDYADEDNGCYEHRCLQCKATFYGHKDRRYLPLCRECGDCPSCEASFPPDAAGPDRPAGGGGRMLTPTTLFVAGAFFAACILPAALKFTVGIVILLAMTMLLCFLGAEILERIDALDARLAPPPDEPPIAGSITEALSAPINLGNNDTWTGPDRLDTTA